jgi:hypothetical protein
VLDGLGAEIEEDRARLLVDFELRAPTEHTLPRGETLMFASRPSLPSRRLDDPMIETRSWLQIRDSYLRVSVPQRRNIAGTGGDRRRFPFRVVPAL